MIYLRQRNFPFKTISSQVKLTIWANETLSTDFELELPLYILTSGGTPMAFDEEKDSIGMDLADYASLVFDLEGDPIQTSRMNLEGTKIVISNLQI